MQAAREIFTQNGYLGASMDAIAARAAVSKRTVYHHFEDKKQLFKEVVLDTVDRGYEAFRPAILALQETDDLEPTLRQQAQLTLKGVMSPEVLQMRRLVMAEADRFPDVGREYYNRSWVRTLDLLGSAFERLTQRGLLDVKDAHHAAYMFTWMVVSIPLNRVAFTGNSATFTPDELEQLSEEAVRVFLAAYGAKTTVVAAEAPDLPL